MKPTESVMTTKGSTFNPGESSVYSSVSPISTVSLSGLFRYHDLLNIVLVLPPAPAALVLVGL